MSTVEIVLRDGPVVIPSLRGAGVDRSFRLWNDITASEVFPADARSAFYVLSLRKHVAVLKDVRTVEQELLSALRLLAMVWPFCGGSFLVISSREVITSERFESNASRVEAELLASTGLQQVISPLTVCFDILATYSRPPLENASIAAAAVVNNYGLRRLLGHHQAAWLDYHRPGSERHSWFTDLYKVREFLRGLNGGNEESPQQQLGISRDDWGFFGRILNTRDLRHAELTGVMPPVAEDEVTRLFRLAYVWTRTHLTALGIPMP